MKKIVIAESLCLLFLFLASTYFAYQNWEMKEKENSQIIQWEVYESEKEYLLIGYCENGKEIQFSRYEKQRSDPFEVSYADVADENTAVLDGKKMFPPSEALYYRFVFQRTGRKCIEFFNKEEMVGIYDLVLCHK